MLDMSPIGFSKSGDWRANQSCAAPRLSSSRLPATEAQKVIDNVLTVKLEKYNKTRNKASDGKLRGFLLAVDGIRLLPVNLNSYI